jgi:transposase
MLDMMTQNGPIAGPDIAGIDVAKAWLDVCVAGKLERVDNKAAAIARLGRRLKAAGVAMVGLEPTGGYERLAVAVLGEAGLDVRMVDSWRLRQFAKSRGTRTKTDLLDARMIADFLAREGARPFPRPTPAQQALVTWTREVTRADADLRRLKTRLGVCALAEIAQLLKAEMAALKATIAMAEAAIARIIAEDPELTRRAKRLASIPGVGPKTVRVLLAEMPELGALEGKSAAALAGLAAYQRQSGRKKPRGVVEGGRAALKRAAFLAARAMRLHNPWASALHAQLLARGKAFKVATVALARRFIVIANAMIRDDHDWIAEPAS